MSTKKTVLALAILVLVGFGVAFAVHTISSRKASDAFTTDELRNGFLANAVTRAGVSYVVPPSRIFDFGVDVPEITEPKYVSVEVADAVIADGLPGVSIEVNEQRYFFPYQVLNWHQVVHVDIDGTQLTVTHDPLCYSDRVYAASGITHAGKVYNNNALLLNDRGDLYEQGTGRGVSGDAIGETLALYPYETMLWMDWKEAYPDGQVLSTDTGVVRDYTRHPFGAYDENGIIYFPHEPFDDRFAEKWILDGIVVGEDSAASLRNIARGFGVENFELNGSNYVLIYDFEKSQTFAYKGEVDGRRLMFMYDFDDEEWRDEETGSVWGTDGIATDGELEGSQLERVQTLQSSWFCWASQYTDTQVGHADSVEEVIDEEEGVFEVDLSDIE